MKELISIEGLTKQYGSLTAVDGIDLSVHQGSLFAFLGPNGAGKSTTINILCTLLQKTAGAVHVAGFAVGKEDEAIRRIIGVVFQNNVLDTLLTVEENLMSRGALYGGTQKELKTRAAEVADILGITDLLGRRYGKLSGGQKRRAEIGRALMNNPKILFLDEPTTGLDPQTRIVVWKTIRRLQDERGMTVFLTTHYMEEASAADWVALIDYGKIVVEGTPDMLKQEYSTDILRLFPAADSSEQILRGLDGRAFAYEDASASFRIPLRDSLEALTLLNELNGSYRAFEVLSGSMDDVFLNVTGHQIREDV